MRIRNGLWAALLCGVVALIAGCGGGGGGGTPVVATSGPVVPGLTGVTASERAAMPDDIAMGRLGEGTRRVYVMRKEGTAGRQPVVIFFHGYGTATVASQEPWLTHLASRSTVVWPVYNAPPYDRTEGGERLFPDAAAGLRSTLAALERGGLIDPGHLVVAGYSLGGALASDYARAAKDHGLPAPDGLFLVMSGRGLCDGPVRVPPQPGQIPRGTRILAIASRHDLLAGICESRRVVAGARAVQRSRKHLRILSDFEVGDHFAPTRTGPREQRVFWRPLDRLLARVAG